VRPAGKTLTHKGERYNPARMTLRPFTAVPILTAMLLALSAVAQQAPQTVSSGEAVEPKVPVVVYLGDSLTAGLGLSENEAFPGLVGKALEARDLPVRTVNAGVSGDTTAGGARRIDWILRQRPDVVVIELGANDALRGLSPAMTEENLRLIGVRALAAGAKVLLVGMKVPPNYGPEFVRNFESIFPRLAGELGVPLMPFLLEGVAGRPDLNQADGIHPNAKGHRIIAESMLPYLDELVRSL